MIRFLSPLLGTSEGTALASRYDKPESQAYFLFRLAFLYQTKGNRSSRFDLVDQARQWYRQCLVLAPNSVSAANNLADIYSKKGEHDSAVAVLKAVIASIR